MMQVSGVDTDALTEYMDTHPAYWHLDPTVPLPDDYEPETLKKTGFRWLREIDELIKQDEWPQRTDRLPWTVQPDRDREPTKRGVASRWLEEIS